MGLFQTSVLKKYRKLQDKKAVEKAYKKYATYFHNPERQENIRESKEEQFQEGFLRELFVKVFDYTLNPEPQFNLTTELKNEKGAKKADGAILKDGKALAVIELKSTKTKDLEKVRQQAFDYKANHSECVYVITSNFEKLRFYINNAVDFEEFNLFTLNEEQFELLYLCLHKENVLQNIPLKIKTDSVVAEEKITKTFYSDYSLFKRELFRDLVKQNLNNEIFKNELQKEDKDRATKNIKLSLFKKSQKLIDRFLFIFFAEDKGLLPPNSTLRILKDWDKLNELDTDIPLYNRFKLYFKYLDEGRKGTNGKAEIFAYNGGLFKPDPILDSLILDNQLLYKHTKILSDYDFESQVGVNILGHIFENSLNEIESVNAEIEGTDFDKQKTKRKKDGVFYTPKYITKYIVDNTVGKLCEEKKQELEIKEEEYHKSRKGRKTETIKKLKAKLTEYRNWLLSLTILDPACGSGAFLNQALDFLIKEHSHIDELETSLFGGGMVFQNIENTILENNIFGVDLNEESVEIAKLSLWLRTAQPRRKLNTLNNNIKCGNSLIDDPKVAEDKAFNWQNEFSNIFENGGFDVVIGNPPYVKARDNDDIEGRTHIEKNYRSPHKMWDLYVPFIEKAINISTQNGLSAMIIPDTIGKSEYTNRLVEIIENENYLYQIDFFPNIYVFENVGVRSKILFIQNIKSELLAKKVKHYPTIYDTEVVDYTKGKGNEQYLLNVSSFSINRQNCSSLADICYVSYGMRLNSDKSDPDKFKKTDLLSKSKTEIHTKLYTEGKYLERYCINSSQYLEYDTERCPRRLVRPTFPEIYPPNKLLLSRQKKVGTISYDSHYCDNTIIMAIPAFELIGVDNNSIKKYYKNINKDRLKVEAKSKEFNLHYLLGIINSRLINYYIHFASKGKIDFYPDDWKNIPIKNCSKIEQSKIIVKVETILKYVNNLSKITHKLINYIQIQFANIDVTRKLNSWHELDFADFIKELNKAIKKVGGKKLTKKDEMEWMELFEEKKTEAQTLKTEIEKTDKEIDQMVYELYGLTEEEIKIVEGAV